MKDLVQRGRVIRFPVGEIHPGRGANVTALSCVRPAQRSVDRADRHARQSDSVNQILSVVALATALAALFTGLGMAIAAAHAVWLPRDPKPFLASHPTPRLVWSRP